MTEDVKLWSEVRERELWFVISLDRTARGCVGMFNIPDSHAWRVDVLVFQFSGLLLSVFFLRYPLVRKRQMA